MFYVYKRVDVSMMIIYYASDIIEYDSGIIKLSNAPLHIT